MVSSKESAYWRPAMLAFARMSGWVVGPVLVGIFLGKWLDKKLGTTPILFAVTLGTMFLFSCFGIVKEAKKTLKTLEKENPPKPKTDESHSETLEK